MVPSNTLSNCLVEIHPQNVQNRRTSKRKVKITNIDINNRLINYEHHHRFENKFNIISSGGFGTVFDIIDKLSGQHLVEKICALDNNNDYGLLKEYNIYKEIGNVKAFEYYKRNNYAGMFMEKFGKDLFELVYDQKNNKFSLKTVLQIGIQLLDEIEIIHNKGFLHRDLKPQNIVKGLNDNSIKIIDYGLATKYDLENPCENIFKGYFVGTVYYCSKRCDKEYVQSRRDDLESIGYVLIFLLTGKLPWIHIPWDKEQQVIEKKSKTTIEEICHGLPIEFKLYLLEVSTYDFYQKPNYDYLRQLFRNLFEKNNFKNDNIYDWNNNINNTNISKNAPPKASTVFCQDINSQINNYYHHQGNHTLKSIKKISKNFIKKNFKCLFPWLKNKKKKFFMNQELQYKDDNVNLISLKKITED